VTRKITVDILAPGTVDNDWVSTVDGTLASDAQRTWLDDLAGTGSASLEIKVGHADEALVVARRLVRFNLLGTARWWGIIEAKSKVLADPSRREAGRVITVNLRGALALLQYARVLSPPALGLGRVTPTSRWFGWMADEYDDTTWDDAVELKQQSDGSDPWSGAPMEWPDEDAWWIGPVDGTTPPIEPGVVYLRGGFTVGVGDGGDYRFSITADDGFRYYLDANLAEEEQKAGLWGVTRYFDLPADEGDHTVALELINFDRPDPSTNVAGLIWSIAPMLGGGIAAGSPVARSDGTMKMLAFPASVPGMTAGHIMATLVDEAKVRGWAPFLFYDFDDVDDSNGTPWPKEVNLAFPVGTSLLEVAMKLTEQRLAWFNITEVAGVLTLHAACTPGVDRTGEVTIAYGSNIGQLADDELPPEENTLYSFDASGRLVQFQDATAADDWGVLEGALSLGSASDEGTAEDQADAFFADHAQPAHVTGECRLEGDVVPYEDFLVGDTVTAPQWDGTGGAEMVTGIRVGEENTPAGTLVFAIDSESA
jgi:hypothetical protein